MIKVSQWIKKGKKYLRNMTKSHAAMRYIVWSTKMQPDLVEMRNFLHEISGAAWIAVIGFLAKSFIDRDNNGIPDQYEEEKENKDGKSASERHEPEL